MTQRCKIRHSSKSFTPNHKNMITKKVYFPYNIFYSVYRFVFKGTLKAKIHYTEAVTGGVLRKGVLINFAKSTGKHLCQSLFWIKLYWIFLIKPATLLEKRLWHRCFSVNFDKFLTTPFLQNSSGRLLLTTWLTIYYLSDSDAVL